MRGTRVTAVGIASAAIVFLATGCAVAGASPGAEQPAPSATHVQTRTQATPTPTPTPTPTADAAEASPALSGVIATGTLASSDGSTSGTIVLTAADGVVTATIDDFHSTATGQLDLDLTPYATTATCPSDSWRFVMNGVNAEPHTWSLPISIEGGPFEVDPSYLRSAVVHVDSATGTAGPDGCITPVLAAAPLTWDVPDTHAGLVVADHGTRADATGTTTSTDGVPSTYTVAPGDTFPAIRQRFALTKDDFEYLNPFTADASDGALRYGTVYNLSAADRGAPPA